MKIKICGITDEAEVEKLNDLQVDYAGFILFFEKSKRNNSLERAAQLKNILRYSLPVAVVVSPTIEQVDAIAEAGFAILQVHGTLTEEVKKRWQGPLWRAFQVDGQADCCEKLHEIVADDRIETIVLDGAVAGSGKTFAWELMENLSLGDKYFALAGGLNPENVAQAVKLLRPDIVDVSSGVEYPQKERVGKDLRRMEQFVENARQADGR